MFYLFRALKKDFGMIVIILIFSGMHSQQIYTLRRKVVNQRMHPNVQKFTNDFLEEIGSNILFLISTEFRRN
jgi:hypothetical protein